VAEFPDVVYILLGATHPHELRTRGEAYRLGLEAIVKEHKLEKHVIFHNRFVELKELTEFIGSADLYITPYLDEAQSTSGTLAYAFGAGKAVISTPYWHAAELLRDERGVLVPFGDPRAIAREAGGLLRDKNRRTAMSDNAYRLGREMVWSNTAGLYMRSFEAARRQESTAPRKSVAARESGYRPYQSPEFNLDHLYHMTDATGIFQHASFTTPNPAEGYCTDDNARALILACCWSNWKKSRSVCGRWPQPTPRSWTRHSIRRRSDSTISSAVTAAGWTNRVGRLPWPGDLGVGHRGRAGAALEFAEDGRTTLLASSAGGDGLHFAAGLGLQPDRH